MTDWTPEKQRWLEDSCRASGVPLKVTDPVTLARIAVLLGVPTQGELMARNEAAKIRQGLSSKNGKATRSAREVGQYGNSRPRDDAHVRRARRMETDGRLKAAQDDLAAHERKLAELDASLDGQVHIPYRPDLTIVPEPEETAAVPDDPMQTYFARANESFQAAQRERGEPDRAEPDQAEPDLARALELIDQGYHVARVATRTGVPVDRLQNLVGKDGYRRGGA